MTFEQAKEIATVINSAGDQIVNLAILTIAGAAAFVVNYRDRIRGCAWFCFLSGVTLIVLAAIASFVIKGLLITMLQNLAEDKKPTVQLDDLNIYASIEFAFILFGLILLAVAIFLPFQDQQPDQKKTRSVPAPQGQKPDEKKTPSPPAQQDLQPEKKKPSSAPVAQPAPSSTPQSEKPA
jgi:hypothetical protein